MSKGFTLLEVLVAIFLLTLGIGGVFILVNQTGVSSQLTSSRLVASYLAQEGIEIVRNIRDTNFLKVHKGVEGADWLNGLNDSEIEINLGVSFKRKIIISDIIDLDDPPDGINDRIKVLVEVSWQERGRGHKVTAQEFLYRWWQ